MSTDIGYTPAELDRYRILNTPHFRRLGGVTQVMPTAELPLFHNRLTHSLKVADTGQELAHLLLESTSPHEIAAAGGIDPTVVAAAGLAHDIGHPPFGHVGEEELQSLITYGGDSFEGNAQSFRVVTKLATGGSIDVAGLNLTRATLRAVLKYPWIHNDPMYPKSRSKWGAYLTEQLDLDFALHAATTTPSLEALLMDIADDITYAIHDCMDFYRIGLLPLHLLANSHHEARIFYDYLASQASTADLQNIEEVLERLRTTVFPREPYRGTVSDEALVEQISLTLRRRFIRSVSLAADGSLVVDHPTLEEIHVLKQLTWFYVIDGPGVATLQLGQRRVVRTLFEELRTWIDKSKTDPHQARRLPAGLRTALARVMDDEEAQTATQGNHDWLAARTVADYIALLTEGQAIDLFQRLTGASAGSALERWLGQ